MVTTIQINEQVKDQLDKIKTKKETYEQVILNLMQFAEDYQREQTTLLIEGCKAMGEESIKITKEFEGVENLEKWEW